MQTNNYITRLTFDLLTKNSEARDNMMLTVQYVHDFEMAMFSISQSDYYSALFSGKLSSIKTLDRVWRKIQEIYPELRGSEWQERQVQAGLMSAAMLSEVKNQLGLFD